MGDPPEVGQILPRLGAVETQVAGHEGRLRDMEVWSAQFGAEMLGEMKRQSEMMQQQLHAFQVAENIRTEDHDTLLRICERMEPLTQRLDRVEKAKRDSTIRDAVIAIVTGVLGYLGIKFGNP